MSSEKKVIFITPKIKTRKKSASSNPSSKTNNKEKLFYRLEEVCLLTQLSPETIETWEEELPFLHSGRTRTGRKIFRSKDVTIIQSLTTTRQLNPEKLQKTIYEIREQPLEIQRLLRPRKK